MKTQTDRTKRRFEKKKKKDCMQRAKKVNRREANIEANGRDTQAYLIGIVEKTLVFRDMKKARISIKT